MRLAFAPVALAIVIIAGPALATSTTAAAASHAPAGVPAPRIATGLKDSHDAPHAQPPGGTQLWRALYSLGFGGEANAVVVSPDGSRVFVTGSVTGPRRHTRIATVAYQAATGARLWVAAYLGPVNTNSTATSAVVSPDGQQVFVTGRTATQHGVNTGVTVAYQAATGAKAWTALSPGASFGSAAISPDGSTLFTVGTNQAAMLTVAYNAASGATRLLVGSAVMPPPCRLLPTTAMCALRVFRRTWLCAPRPPDRFAA